MIISVFDRVENLVGKGEIACKRTMDRLGKGKNGNQSAVNIVSGCHLMMEQCWYFQQFRNL